jgi:hypothetical protein
MSWKIKQTEEPDPLVARLHPLVLKVQLRLRDEGRRSKAIDVLRECLVCLETASSHTFGFRWPTTETTEYYGDGPDPANVDVVQDLTRILSEGVPADVIAHAASVLQRGEHWQEDGAVKMMGERASAVTKAFLKCLDLPDALS